MMAPDVIETHSGALARPMDLQPEDVRIEDVAFALSNESRFGGHTRWCVADHCLLVVRILECWHACERTRMHGLLHDAHEAYLRDLPAPIKRFLPGYKDACDRAQEAVLLGLGVGSIGRSDRDTVKHADRTATLLEADRRMPSRAREWPDVGEQEWEMAEGVRARTALLLDKRWHPGAAERAFMLEYKTLWKELTT